MVVRIFTSPTDYTIDPSQFSQDDVLIGVDYGAYYALKAGVKLTLALGDFDSTTEDEKAYVFKHAQTVKQHSNIKDLTDTALAVKEALRYDADEIIIYGGVGNRFDHTYANMLLLKLGPITCVTDQSEMFVLDPGSYHIHNDFPFISFFAIENVKQLTLKGFNYELETYDLDIDDPLCISNQGAGHVAFNEGLLLIIKSQD